MAILQISRIQSRRGLYNDLPRPLASAELGWCLDTRQLFIGNGDTTEGAPQIGNTEILTTESNILDFESGYTFRGEEAGGYAVQTGPSALAPAERSMQNKFDDIVNFRDFGGVGDGDTNDVDAFNRAITELHMEAGLSNSLVANPRLRRTLHIPAGTYVLTGDVIRMLPYVKLKGDGKNSTFIIQTDAAETSALVAVEVPGITRGNIEIEDLTIAHTSNTRDIVKFDGVQDGYFSRVRFQYTTWTLQNSHFTTDWSTMPVVVGSGTAGVRLDASVSGAQQSNRLVFNQCDFVATTYGLYITNSINGVRDVSITNSYFHKLYQGAEVGDNDVGGTVPPSGVRITHSTFNEVFRQGIRSTSSGTQLDTITAGAVNIVSAFNSYINVGRQGSPAPGSAVYSVIDYNGKNSYSIGDTFEERLLTDAILINFNNNLGFATLSNGGLQLGGQITSNLDFVSLLDNQTDTVVIGVGYAPIILDYAIASVNDKRTGIMKITTDGVDVTYEDEYVETTDFGISMVPSVSGANVILTYDTNASTLGGNSATFKVTTRTLI